MTANTLTAVTPKLLAQGLMALRQRAVMPRLVNRQYETLAGEKGSTIDVPIPSAITAAAVSPNYVPPDTAAVVPTSVAIALDQWYEAPFFLSDKDLLTAMDGFMPMQASEAIKSLANNVDNYLLALYTAFYGYVGTAGTTPFGTEGDVSDATDCRVVLNKQLAPLDDRHVVMSPETEGNALNQRAFQDASWAGDPQAIMEGNLNRKLGFQWWMNQNVPTHTAGTITTGLIAKAATAVAAGLKTCVGTTAGSTGACSLKVGDIITFAGQTQTYTMTAVAVQASAASDVTLAFEPGLKTALAGSEAITVKSDHVVNLAFHRDAIAFATRPLQSIVQGLGVIVQSAVDPITGLTLRLEITREYKRTRFSYDILYGAKVVRAELGCRLAG